MSSSTEVHRTQVWNVNADDVHVRSKSKQALNSNDDDLRESEGDFSQSMWNEIKEKVYKSSDAKSETQEPSKSPTQDENYIIRPKPIPSIVLSVVGDSISFFPRPWPKAVFQTALIEAAKSGGETWILYRGSDYEVSKLVENAYQHYENLEFGNDSVNIHDRRRHIKLINISGKKTGQQSKKDLPTIFKTEKGEKDSLLLNFEQYISQQDIEYIEEYVKITVPIAIIVCEGDLKTIKKVAIALENKLPVIIMKGSGKAADLVLDFLEKPDTFKKNASILFGIELNDGQIADMEADLKHISDYRYLVAVFDLYRDDPLMLSSIVGAALVSCLSIGNIYTKEKTDDVMRNKNKNRKTMGESYRQSLKNFSLAKSNLTENSKNKNDNLEKSKWNAIWEKLKWKSETYVLNPEFCSATYLPLYFFFGYQIFQNKEEHGVDEDTVMKAWGSVLLFEALKANRCDYVKVLLDQGVKFNEEKLSDLYLDTISYLDCRPNQEECRRIQWILEKLPRARRLRRSCELIIKSSNKDSASKPANKIKDEAEKMCQDILEYEDKSRHKDCLQGFRCRCQKSNKVDHFPPKKESIADVLLWAILVDRKELAEICWLRGEDHLFTGLVCSAILTKLSEDANDVKEHVLSEHLKEHSRVFQQRCINVMDRMLEENEERTLSLLDSKTSVWGIQSSPLTFAYENFMYDVIAHTCSQKYMNNKWYSGLPRAKWDYFKCLFSQPMNFIKSTRTKYIINIIMFLSVLFTYSAFVLTSVSTKYYTKMAALEYYVYIWSFGDGYEEMRGCIDCEKKEGNSHRGYIDRMGRHLYDFWNVVDLLSYLLLITALIVRHSYEDEAHVIARNTFAFSLLVMYLRFLEVFLINKILGPILMMIKEMLKDLSYFLLIAVFVILGVGIYYHANLWPDHQAMWNGGFPNWRIWKIIYYPYWQLYGEFNLDVLEGSDNLDCNVTSILETDMSTNVKEDWTVTFIAAIFVLFSNLLLVNLVIAMFSYTFERVQNMSEKLWHFQTYTVVIDYDHRIPSPFNLVLRPILCFLKKDPPKDKKEEQREKSALRSFQKIIALRYYNKN